MNNDQIHDEQVAAAYKDLARERAPEQLDRNILRRAKARAKRPQYSRWTAWSRPLAWAATVALCLAITLEVTQITTPDDLVSESSPTEVAVPASVRAPELQKDKRERVADRDTDQLSEQVESMSDAMTEAASAEKIMPARSPVRQAANEPAPAAEIEAKEADELRREDLAVASGFSAAQAIAADMPDSECSDESRAEPDSWLECIAALEAAGDKEAALRQREILIDTFPDFKLP